MRLIDADALTEAIKARQKDFSDGGYDEWLSGQELGLDHALDCVDDAHTVDAAPVVHGRWEYKCSGRYSNFGHCTNCGHAANSRNADGREMKYCPNCGAKMDLKGSEKQ